MAGGEFGTADGEFGTADAGSGSWQTCSQDWAGCGKVLCGVAGGGDVLTMRDGDSKVAGCGVLLPGWSVCSSMPMDCLRRSPACAGLDGVAARSCVEAMERESVVRGIERVS